MIARIRTRRIFCDFAGLALFWEGGQGMYLPFPGVPRRHRNLQSAQCSANHLHSGSDFWAISCVLVEKATANQKFFWPSICTDICAELRCALLISSYGSQHFAWLYPGRPTVMGRTSLPFSQVRAESRPAAKLRQLPLLAFLRPRS